MEDQGSFRFTRSRSSLPDIRVAFGGFIRDIEWFNSKQRPRAGGTVKQIFVPYLAKFKRVSFSIAANKETNPFHFASTTDRHRHIRQLLRTSSTFLKPNSTCVLLHSLAACECRSCIIFSTDLSLNRALPNLRNSKFDDQGLRHQLI